jgi:hypothetical protein
MFANPAILLPALISQQIILFSHEDGWIRYIVILINKNDMHQKRYGDLKKLDAYAKSYIISQ